jgi:hypothetical protein
VNIFHTNVKIWRKMKIWSTKGMRKRDIDPNIALAKNLKKKFTTTFADLRTIDRKPEVFLKNIQYLIKHCNATQENVAKKANVPSTWLRQLTRRGLGQLRDKNTARLDRLRRFFPTGFRGRTMVGDSSRGHRWLWKPQKGTKPDPSEQALDRN